MTHADGEKILAAAKAALSHRIAFGDLLAKLSAKNRNNVERRILVLDEQSDVSRKRVWQRLACGLMTLAPNAEFAGRQNAMFFAPDGKYKMQVFALEDMQDGNVTVYCPNVLDEAVEAGVLTRTGNAEPHGYAVAASNEPLPIYALDGNTLNPESHFKNLTNWKRTALRIKLSPSPSVSQVEAAELLCAIASRHFEPAAPLASA